MHQALGKWRIRSKLIRGCLAEFLSAFIHVGLTIICMAASFFSGNKDNYLLNCMGAGLAVFFAVHIDGGVTGAILNPAVTFAFATLGKVSVKEFVFFSLSQYSGGFFAGALVFLTFQDSFNHLDPADLHYVGPNGTSALFGTFPAPHLTFSGVFINSVVATSLLVLGVLSISDERNWKPASGLLGLINGLFVITLNMAFAFNSSAAMNPARDLSPRFFSYLAGWGPEVFTYWECHWFYVPVLSSYAGALLGSLVYTLFIGMHWDPEQEELRSLEQKTDPKVSNVYTKYPTTLVNNGSIFRAQAPLKCYI